MLESRSLPDLPHQAAKRCRFWVGVFSSVRRLESQKVRRLESLKVRNSGPFKTGPLFQKELNFDGEKERATVSGDRLVGSIK